MDPIAAWGSLRSDTWGGSTFGWHVLIAAIFALSQRRSLVEVGLAHVSPHEL